MRRPVLAAVAALLLALPARAQELRTFTTARQLHGDTRLTAVLEYPSGSLTVTPGPGNHLYRMLLTFDDRRSRPVSTFDASVGTVRLGAEPAGGTAIRVGNPEAGSQNAVIQLSPRVDLSLDIALGSADASIELGGLRVTDLRMTSGASRTALRFSRPNATRCATAAIEAGAAELTVAGLGNSRCDTINVQGGIGQLTLDFSGDWRESADVAIRMTAGELVLRLPRAVGVRLSLDRLLASFQPAGLERRGTTYVSPGYDAAGRTLDIAITTAVGGVRVEWID